MCLMFQFVFKTTVRYVSLIVNIMDCFANAASFWPCVFQFLFFMNDYLHKEHPQLMDFDYSPDNKDPLPPEYLKIINKPHISNPFLIDPKTHLKSVQLWKLSVVGQSSYEYLTVDLWTCMNACSVTAD